MGDVSRRKERINAEAAEHTEGTEQKWKGGSTGLELSDWVLRSARRKHPGFPNTLERNTVYADAVRRQRWRARKS